MKMASFIFPFVLFFLILPTTPLPSLFSFSSLKSLTNNDGVVGFEKSDDDCTVVSAQQKSYWNSLTFWKIINVLLCMQPELITKYGFPVELHDVTTEDGYILTLHRIPHGRNESKIGNKPVIFLQHGFLGSSADWILNTVDKALGE